MIKGALLHMNKSIFYVTRLSKNVAHSVQGQQEHCKLHVRKELHVTKANVGQQQRQKMHEPPLAQLSQPQEFCVLAAVKTEIGSSFAPQVQ